MQKSAIKNAGDLLKMAEESREICEEKNIPYTYVSSKEELGNAAGLGIPTSAIAIVSPGKDKELVDNIIKKIDAVKKQG